MSRELLHEVRDVLKQAERDQTDIASEIFKQE